MAQAVYLCKENWIKKPPPFSAFDKQEIKSKDLLKD